jgi:sugar phosphate isomerase/epimerase
MKLLEGRETVIQICLISDKYEPSDPSGDDEALPLIAKFADEAAKYNIRVAIYPHINLWGESPWDSLRIIEKLGRENLGTAFNLLHWEKLRGKTGEKRSIEQVIDDISDHLYLVSINGFTPDIMPAPLDEGGYDFLPLLRKLKDVGYKGPMGLQCYRIAEDPRVHLARSMDVWKKLKKKL